jgi:hypothetical protein
VNHEAVRRALERLIGSPLADSEWKWLGKRRYISEIESREGSLEEAAEEAATEIRDGRRAFGGHGGNYGRSSIRSELQRTQRTALTDDPRVRALSQAVAHFAQQDDQLQHFRRTILRGQLLSAADADRWIRRQSGTQRHSKAAVRLYGTGTRALSRLEMLARDLSDVYAWAEPDAERFVLTGRVPPVFPIRVTTENRRLSVLDRIVLSVDPMVPPNQLAALYRGVRRIFHSGRARRITAKHAQLGVVALLKPTKQSWAETLKRWNASCQTSERYSLCSNFTRDCLRAKERLLGHHR